MSGRAPIGAGGKDYSEFLTGHPQITTEECSGNFSGIMGFERRSGTKAPGGQVHSSHDAGGGSGCGGGSEGIGSGRDGDEGDNICKDKGDNKVGHDQGEEALLSANGIGSAPKGDLLDVLGGLDSTDLAQLRRLLKFLTSNNKITVDGNSSVPKHTPVWTVETVKTPNSTSRRYEIPECLFNHLENGQHLPLTLLTSSMIEKFHIYPGFIKTKNIWDSTGNKKTLLDLSNYPLEYTLPIAQFHEAWGNNLRTYRQVSDDAIYKKWLAHYEFLSTVDHFEENYEVILRFDIDVRRRFTHTREAFDGPNYLQRWNEMCLTVMIERVETYLGGAPRCQGDSRNRYAPYNKQSFRGYKPL
ncbi:hypothetical protein BDQ12DRAFT_715803 [Crucibulum laeve]|uniref:Uncharacterized protein n=1 Tax=Crucibulum laeve TaxID=68775 RepID=A0A5C3LK59_9AGAR|nr:hypothetical protein BDQ12DRAFT_715803 [Crucibulum laeve]